MKHTAALFALLSASLFCAHAERMRGMNTELVQMEEEEGPFDNFYSFCNYSNSDEEITCLQSFCVDDANETESNVDSADSLDPSLDNRTELRDALQMCGAPEYDDESQQMPGEPSSSSYRCEGDQELPCLRHRFYAHCANRTATETALRTCNSDSIWDCDPNGDPELGCMRRHYNARCLFCSSFPTIWGCKFQDLSPFCRDLNCQGTDATLFPYEKCTKYNDNIWGTGSFCLDIQDDQKRTHCNEFVYLMGYQFRNNRAKGENENFIELIEHAITSPDTCAALRYYHEVNSKIESCSDLQEDEYEYRDAGLKKQMECLQNTYKEHCAEERIRTLALEAIVYNNDDDDDWE